MTIWLSSGNKKREFLKWVEFLNWNRKSKVRKGRKNWREQKYGQ